MSQNVPVDSKNLLQKSIKTLTFPALHKLNYSPNIIGAFFFQLDIL